MPSARTCTWTTRPSGVVALATDNLAVLPAEWVSEDFGISAPPSVYDRVYLIMSLAFLG